MYERMQAEARVLILDRTPWHMTWEACNRSAPIALLMLGRWKKKFTTPASRKKNTVAIPRARPRLSLKTQRRVSSNV